MTVYCTCGGVAEPGGELPAVPDGELLVLLYGGDGQEEDLLPVLVGHQILHTSAPALVT